jgi:hypothetical protein
MFLIRGAMAVEQSETSFEKLVSEYGMKSKYLEYFC